MNDEEKANMLRRLLKMQGLIVESFKKQELLSVLSTEKLQMVYNELDGSKSASDIAKIVGVSRVRVAGLLPEWEKLGIVISEGLGPHKRYLNLRSVANYF